MIKRRFYREEHGERSSADSSSSSDSESESGSDLAADADEPEPDSAREEDDPKQEEAERDDEAGGGDEADEGDEDEGDEDEGVKEGSGYESEDSYADGPDGHSSDESAGVQNSQDICKPTYPIKAARAKDSNNSEAAKSVSNVNESVEGDLSTYILKHKSVFKCKLCPRVVCLNEGAIDTHLKSKGHARSKKLFKAGRLKLMLNSDGEMEELQETHAERHARITALAQSVGETKRDAHRNRMRKRKQRSKDRRKNKEGQLEKTAEKEGHQTEKKTAKTKRRKTY